MIVIGLDLSKLHYGMTLVKNDAPACFSYMANSKKLTDASFVRKINGFDGCLYSASRTLQKKEYPYKPVFDIEQIQHTEDAILATVSGFWRDDIYVCIEDYAYTQGVNSVTSLAEMTGYIKASLYTNNCRLRLYDPMSLKLWTGDGKAEKADVQKYVEQFVEFPPELTDSKVGLDIVYDLADSFVLYQMLAYELQTRKDPSFAKKYLTEQQIRVFNRTTRAKPVNVLDRPFIKCKEN